MRPTLISKETTDAIFEKADLASTLRAYQSLRGNDYGYMCSRHNSGECSVKIQPKEDLYVCTMCGKGGNAINFIMSTRGWDYHEAMIYLAAKYNVPIKHEYGIKQIDEWLETKQDESDYISRDTLRKLLHELANEVNASK